MADNLSNTKRTSQAMDNLSFDEKYNQNAVELLVENAGETALERQKMIATEETLQAVAKMNYDNILVDTTNPASIVVTKKMGAVVVDVKTVNII